MLNLNYDGYMIYEKWGPFLVDLYERPSSSVQVFKSWDPLNVHPYQVIWYSIKWNLLLDWTHNFNVFLTLFFCLIQQWISFNWELNYPIWVTFKGLHNLRTWMITGHEATWKLFHFAKWGLASLNHCPLFKVPNPSQGKYNLSEFDNRFF